MRFDIAIIGGGCVGCAVASRFSLRYSEKRIAVFEKLGGVALETSGLNSGVLHSGLHQAPGSLKAELARKGSALAVGYHEKYGLPILRTGMLVLVPWSAVREGLYREWNSLFHLIARGREQKVKFKYLSPLGVRRLEPNIRGLGGIFIPNVWVIDPVLFVNSLKSEAEGRGVEFFFDSPVERINVLSGFYGISTTKVEAKAGMVINAAGLYADEIAKLAGIDKYKVFPWRGEYYEVVPEKRGLAKHLIYPAVPADSPGKGIHFSPRVDGRLFIGPNARPVPRKDYYAEDKTPKEKFLEITKKFCPELEADDLTWGYSGIRPKLSAGAEETDFIIRLDRTDQPFLNLIGIESPGLASSMAIAEYTDSLLAPFLF